MHNLETAIGDSRMRGAGRSRPIRKATEICRGRRTSAEVIYLRAVSAGWKRVVVSLGRQFHRDDRTTHRSEFGTKRKIACRSAEEFSRPTSNGFVISRSSPSGTTFTADSASVEREGLISPRDGRQHARIRSAETGVERLT